MEKERRHWLLHAEMEEVLVCSQRLQPVLVHQPERKQTNTILIPLVVKSIGCTKVCVRVMSFYDPFPLLVSPKNLINSTST